MKKINSNNKLALINADCLEGMREIQSKSVDLVLTDPPYNLGLFMNKRDTNMSKLRENHFVGSDWDNLEKSDYS